MYKLSQDDRVVKKGRISFVIGSGNADDIEYQAWLALGNTPEPADEPTQGELDRREKLEQTVPNTRQWFTDNPNAELLFELPIPDLIQANNNHVDAMFPLATVAQRNREKIWRNTISLVVRVLARQLGLYELL